MNTRKRIQYVIIALLALIGIAGCKPDPAPVLTVSSQDLRFGLSSETQTFVVNANCKWTITKNDDADWYTISPMSGKANDSIVTVTVNDYSGGDYRGSSFVVSSPGGHVYRTVFVSQNKLDFYGIVNKIFGVMSIERWDTDYADQIIEDSYHLYEYNPYDTTQGHLMFFMENGQGVQRNRDRFDHAVYFPFEYEYDPANSILHIVFHLEDETLEPYDPEVLCASDSLYRIIHEFKPHRWERADMRKVGILNPGDKDFLLRSVTKRKGGEPLFITE